MPHFQMGSLGPAPDRIYCVNQPHHFGQWEWCWQSGGVIRGVPLNQKWARAGDSPTTSDDGTNTTATSERDVVVAAVLGVDKGIRLSARSRRGWPDLQLESERGLIELIGHPALTHGPLLDPGYQGPTSNRRPTRTKRTIPWMRQTMETDDGSARGHLRDRLAALTARAPGFFTALHSAPPSHIWRPVWGCSPYEGAFRYRLAIGALSLWVPPEKVSATSPLDGCGSRNHGTYHHIFWSCAVARKPWTLLYEQWCTNDKQPSPQLHEVLEPTAPTAKLEIRRAAATACHDQHGIVTKALAKLWTALTRSILHQLYLQRCRAIFQPDSKCCGVGKMQSELVGT